MKTSNLELYGTEDVPLIPSYIIMRRIELLDEHKAELYEVPYIQRDFNTIRKVEKALKFWERASEMN